MAEVKHLVCDSCGKDELAVDIEEFWFSVQSIGNSKMQAEVSRRVAEQVRERMALGDDGEDAMQQIDVANWVPFGDFCSMFCLGNWAGMQGALRGLEGDS